MTLLLVIIYLAFINLGLPDALIGSAWPVMRAEFNMPLSAAGALSFIVSGGTIVSSLASGKVTRRFGTGAVTLASVCLTCSALFGFSLAHSFWALVALCVPLGLGAGSVDTALNNYVALHYKARHMNWLHSFWGIGATCGPILISLLMGEQHLWRRGYSAIVAVQAAMVVVLLASQPLWKKVSAQSEGDAAAAESGGAAAPALSNKEALKIKGVPLALASFVCYCAAELMPGLWGASFLVSVKAISPVQAAAWVSYYYGGITAGRFVSGILAGKISTKTNIRIGQSLALAGAVLLLLPLPNICCLIAFVLMGLGFAPVYPGMIHETPKRFGKNASATVIGLQMAFAYTGTTCFPPLLGFVAGFTSLAIMPFALLAAITGMFVCCERINALQKRR